ncbi:MAG: rubrerythrin [Planctomycetota bacterium]|nr:rubrerythrin [Planctomycetaceae bacterium]MDQ3331142.1 rubrerythrin [Planctomycetota bacterium]
MAAPTIDTQKNDQIIKELIAAYWSELETIQNYIAASTNLAGIRAQEIKESLRTDIPDELGHAQQLARRIHVLGGTIPGSKDFRATQDTLQPSKDTRDVVAVIRGVLDAEASAIQQYHKIVELCDGVDYVTQDMCITIMGDEQEHHREFLEFLAEYEAPQERESAVRV